MSTALEQHYAVAESITREQARNFYYGIRLLSRQKRSALCALYALARRIDDIGDGDLPTAHKLQELAGVRSQLLAMREGDPGDDPVLCAVADAATAFPIPLTAFDELVDGVEMDARGRRYQSFDELVHYCRCVAGSIGRLCLGVFGSRADLDAARLADVLGIALQQTNILRDIREDLQNGRVYLPTEDLTAFGVRLRLDETGALVDEDGRLSALIRFAAQRAQGWYEEGLGLLPLLDRRSAACCAAMAGIYQRLLAQMRADPTRVFEQRLSLSPWHKAGVAARALAGRPA